MSHPKAQLARDLLAQGRTRQAHDELLRALARHPADPDLNNTMALTAMNLGQGDRAIYFLDRALAAAPAEPTLLTNRGMFLWALNRPDEAIASLRRALSANPAAADASAGLASILRSRRHLSEAAALLVGALARTPDHAPAAALYTGILCELARAADAAAFSGEFLARRPDLQVAIQHARAMTYCPGAAPAQVFEAHAAFGRAFSAAHPPRFTHANTRDPARPLRIGILSNELRRHAVASFLAPYLAHRDRASHLTAYTTGGDDLTDRLRPHFDSWTDLASMPDPAARIHADRIDILIETTGLNQGHRLAVLAARPAPVQLTLLGYLNTLGLRAVDARITDSLTDPPGAEAFSVERLIRLDPTYFCYTPPEAPAPAPLEPGPARFGSFNQAIKLNDPVIDLWSRILAASPASTLLLKAFEFADKALRDDIAARFGARGIEPDRLTIEGPTADASFYANYHRIDIALDPFPFGGTTTTLDALWMGVPVISLAGSAHAGRTGLSILSALRCPELIATTETDYLRLATGLAADPDRVKTYRASLRDRLQASPLCDAPAFARRLDLALRGLWTDYCAGDSP